MGIQEAQGVNVRELLEKKRAEDMRRQAEKEEEEKRLAKLLVDNDSFIASDSDSDSDSSDFKLAKGKEKEKKSKLKKNKRSKKEGGLKNDDGETNGAGNTLTQEQEGDSVHAAAEEVEEEMADSSSSDEDSLVVGSDDDSHAKEDASTHKSKKKVTTTVNAVKTYGKKTILATFSPSDKDAEAMDDKEEEEEATGAQDNYDFLDSLDFVE